MLRLSVNINKIALIRNARGGNLPDLLQVARDCEDFGAQGITVHPRPDQRHIRYDDIPALRAVVRTEFNIEGNPEPDFMDLVCANPPHQCTLVPDSQDQFTSDHGWSLPQDAPALRPVIEELHRLGVRVSLFMDPLPEAMVHAREVGADRVELYTEGYARVHAQAHGTPEFAHCLATYAAAAQAALQAGLGVNAGHDLNRDNLTEFLQAVPGVAEVSIGHALVADALELGYAATVQAYLAAMSAPSGGRP